MKTRALAGVVMALSGCKTVPAQELKPVPASAVEEPVAAAVPIATSPSLVAAGNRTCALSEASTVCWGEPALDLIPTEEGDFVLAQSGPRSPRVLDAWGSGAYDPVRSSMTEYPTGGAVEIAVSSRALCARSDDGTVDCWESSGVQTKVPGLDDAAAIRAGERIRCAIRAAGDVVCWGLLPHATGSADFGSSSEGFNMLPALRVTPTPIPGLGPAVDLSVNAAGVCSVVQSGRIRCLWRKSAELHEPGLSEVISVVVGGEPREGGWGCGLTGDGEVTCFDDDDRLTPVAGVAGARWLRGSGDTFCAGGDDGAVSCWQYPGEAMINGTSAEVESIALRSPAKELASIRDVAVLAVGESHLCARGRDDRLRCLGDNAWGQLRSQAPGMAEPVHLQGATALFSSERLICGQRSGSLACITANGELRWWRGIVAAFSGLVSCLERGRGGEFSAVEIAGLPEGIVDFDGDSDRGCAAHRSGQVYCWQAQAVGLATAKAAPGATRVEGIESIVDVAVSELLACGRRADATVTCWGRAPIVDHHLEPVEITRDFTGLAGRTRQRSEGSGGDDLRARAGHPLERPCRALADKIAALTIEESTAEERGDADAEAIRAMIEATKPDIFRECIVQATKAEIDCALGQSSLDELRRCGE